MNDPEYINKNQLKKYILSNMLGYKNTHSSYDALKHHETLKERVPEKYHKELDCAYQWVKNRNFMTAMDTNTVESWKWLATSMINPPIKVIEKYSNEATSHVNICSHVPSLQKPTQPKCRLCEKPLANNVYEKIKFSVIICKCDKLWCHQKCADDHVMKNGQCLQCKEYFILSPYCSNLKSTFAGK